MIAFGSWVPDFGGGGGLCSTGTATYTTTDATTTNATQYHVVHPTHIDIGATLDGLPWREVYKRAALFAAHAKVDFISFVVDGDLRTVASDGFDEAIRRHEERRQNDITDAILRDDDEITW